jgi:hypothetical protein
VEQSASVLLIVLLFFLEFFHRPEEFVWQLEDGGPQWLKPP